MKLVVKIAVRKKENEYTLISVGNVTIKDTSLTLKQEAQDGTFKEFSLSH